MTCGRGKPQTSSGLATGARIFSISSARMVRRPRSSSCSNFWRGDRLADALRRLGAEVGGDQRLLDVVERRGVERLPGGQAGEILADLVRGLREPAASGGRANSCPHPDQMVAVAAGDARRCRCRRASSRRCATGAKPSLWPLPLFSISTAGVVPTRLSSQRDAPLRRRFAQPRRAGLDHLALELRHARRRRVRARREGEDVGGDDVAIVEQSQASSAPFPRFRSGKPAIRSAPIVASGRAALIRSTMRDRVGAAVAALHPLEDHVVAGLQRQMEMRHQPRLAGDQLEQGLVDLDAVERGQAQALQARLGGEQALAERAEAAFVAGDVDPGEDDLLRAARRSRGRPRRGSPRTAATGSARAPARSCRRCSDGRSRSAPRRSCAPAGGSRRRRSAARRNRATCDTGRPRASPRKRSGSSWAAQPVTRIRASGRSRRARRIAWRVWRTASAVTAQLLTMIQSSSGGRQRAHRLALGEVEAAAERDRLDAHAQRLQVDLAVEHVGRGAAHPDRLARRPGDGQRAARHRHLDRRCGALRGDRGDRGGAGAGAAGAGSGRRRAPRCAAGCRRRRRCGDIDVDPLGEGRVMLDPRAELVERRRRRRRRRRRPDAGCRR